MNHQAGHRRTTHPRSGLTWIDVLVTTLIVIALAALLLPAMRSSRAPANGTRCQNQTKQLLTAVLNFASKKNGRLPSLSSQNETGIVSNWLIDLMPELDNAALFREWEEMSTRERNDLSVSLKMLQCPLDSRSFQVGGGLSYIANAGFGNFEVNAGTDRVDEPTPHGQGSVDWDCDGVVSDSDRTLTIATGCFWPEHSNDRFKASLDYISSGDGLSNTVIIAESTNAGKWNSAETLDLAFVVGLDRIEFPYTDAINKRLFVTDATLGPFGVQGGHIPRHTPSPSSNHHGSVFLGFADGFARQISTKIDPLVYLRFVTPNGQRFGEALGGLKD